MRIRVTIEGDVRPGTVVDAVFLAQMKERCLSTLASLAPVASFDTCHAKLLEAKDPEAARLTPKRSG